MKNELYQPSLSKDGTYGTESYNLGKIFYLVFFGGLIPSIGILMKNAILLKINKKKLYGIITIGVILMAVKIFYYTNAIDGQLSIQAITDVTRNRNVRWGYKALNLLYYLIAYHLMKPKYQQHILAGKETKPLLGDAIAYGFFGGIVEVTILILGVFFLGAII